MRIPTVEKCCCGCDLRFGSAIIGIIFFLSDLGQTIGFSVQADNAEANGEGDSRGTYITSAILSAIMMCCSAVLLWGVHKERPALLRPWLMVYGVLAVIAVLTFIIGAIVSFAGGLGGTGAGFLIAGLVYIAIYGYCLVVVRSFYLSLTGVQPGTV